MKTMAKKKNPHIGQLFDDFLREEGIYEEVQVTATKRVLDLKKQPRNNAHETGRHFSSDNYSK